MKAGIHSWLALVAGLIGCASSGTVPMVRVTNELDLARPRQPVLLPWAEVQASLPGVAPTDVQVVEPASGRPLLTQAVDLTGTGEPELLLFQADFGESETRTFELRVDAEPRAEELTARTFGRHVPERADDFAWENDLVAFRMYGPALAGDPVNSGVDCWLKRVPHPIIDKWYREDQAGKSYHTDHGEGYDPYHVGGSRGCGGLAVWDGEAMHPSSVYAEWKVLTNGPICTVFELTYEPWEVGGKSIREVKRISIFLGQQLAHFESTFLVDGKAQELELAIGITTHDGAAIPSSNPAGGWLRCWETIDDSGLGTGVVLGRNFAAARIEVRNGEANDDGHIFALVKTDPAGKINYCAGYGWERAGEITTPEAWDRHLAEFSRRTRSPLILVFDRTTPRSRAPWKPATRPTRPAIRR